MRYAILASALILSGCAELEALFQIEEPGAAPLPVEETSAETLDPTPAPPPPSGANTAEAFDTTTDEDREAALATPAATGEVNLGSTLATLGDPARPGIWIETPLVTQLVMGRVEVVATGKSINIELRPSGREPGSGSSLSLPAMGLLELPLTAIEEVVVYSGAAA